MSKFELSDKPPQRKKVDTSSAEQSISKEDAFAILEKKAQASKESNAIQEVQDNTLSTNSSIPLGYFEYHPISNGLIPSIPKTLHYKKLDVIETLELSELEYDLLDEQITSFLNGIVLEEYDHANMTEPDRLAVMLFYIAKNTGVIKNDVKGICEECEELITLPRLDLSTFETKDLPSDYTEPYYLKLKLENGKSYVIGLRMATVNDGIEANKYIEKRKLKDKKLKSAKLDFLKKLAKTYSLAIAFTDIEDENGKALDLSNDEKINLFSKELTIKSREYIALYYAKFAYGTDLTTKGVCTNPKCPSKEDNGDMNSVRRQVSITVPFQKSYFALADEQERTLDEVIVHK